MTREVRGWPRSYVWAVYTHTVRSPLAMPAYPVLVDPRFSAARAHFESLLEKVASDEVLGLAHDEVEGIVERDGREVLRLIYQGHLDLRALGESDRAAPVDADGEARPHRRPTSRPLKTVFGGTTVRRLSFTARGAEGGLRPLDAELNLPHESYSHGLRRRAAVVALDSSFDTTVARVEDWTGTRVPKRQVEELVIRAARDFDAFYDQRQEVMVEQDRGMNLGKLVVLSNDGKGIVMRREALREATRKRAERSASKLQTRMSPGEKRNRKRMAEVATVYELEPRPRTPADILPSPEERSDDSSRPARPRPENKRVWASVDKPLGEVVEAAFTEAVARDPWLDRRWVYLVDGNPDQIRVAGEIAAHYGVELVIIIDFIHVLEYLWKAAWCFFDKGDPAVEEWVWQRARLILEGKASNVAAGIHRSATRRGLPAEQRKNADTCAGYLLKNKERLRYDRYLAAGLPIATGVIEGACRHLINDRLGITGARWGLEGAEAILRLRALRSSGDLDEYWAFHRQCELERNHLQSYAASEFTELRRAS